ncbi:MAG: hypothetical protein H0W54_01640 [Rubrobacter sp.]|nr:hypothetical protein [Rubrobacter sp.]
MGGVLYRASPFCFPLVKKGILLTLGEHGVRERRGRIGRQLGVLIVVLAVGLLLVLLLPLLLGQG